MVEQLNIVGICREICQDYDRVNRGRPLPNKVYGENPRLIVLGESHANETDAHQQMQVAQRIQPVFFLHEFLRNNIFDPHQKRVFENPDYPTPAEILEPAMKERVEVEERFGCNPGYDWSTKPREDRRSIEYTKWISDVDFWLNPFACGDFSSNFRSRDGGVERFEKNHPTIELYVGCDTSYLESATLKKEGVGEDRLHAIREKRMVELIREYTMKTEAPVVAVLGAHHIRDESGIHSILQTSDISYMVIDLSFEVYSKELIR